jgi:hypothetical protein
MNNKKNGGVLAQILISGCQDVCIISALWLVIWVCLVLRREERGFGAL